MKKKLYTGYNEYEDIARSMEFGSLARFQRWAMHGVVPVRSRE